MTWGHHPKRDFTWFTWEQEPEAQPPVLTAHHLCFTGERGVRDFELLQENGRVAPCTQPVLIRNSVTGHGRQS